MKAYVFITVAPGTSTNVVGALRQVSGVKSADVCWGLPDIVPLVEAGDSSSLQDVVLTGIQMIAVNACPCTRYRRPSDPVASIRSSVSPSRRISVSSSRCFCSAASYRRRAWVVSARNPESALGASLATVTGGVG